MATVADELESWDAILIHLKENLGKAQLQMFKYANKCRRQVEFAVGDRVSLKVHPIRQTSMLVRHHKLASKF